MQEKQEPQRVDLRAYLEQAPDAPDPFEGIETPDAAPAPVETPPAPARQLAELIRAHSSQAQLVPKAQIPTLMGWTGDETAPQVNDVLSQMAADDSLADIRSQAGERDAYYYSTLHMTDNYAMIAALVLDKNLPRTVAEMVRFNQKTYRLPTSAFNFTRSPYFYTKVQLENVRNLLRLRGEYEDIGEIVTGNDKVYFYCKDGMSERYAKALAEDNEHDEWGYYLD